MIVEPKVKGFICTTAHPEGCRESVRRQIAYCKEKGMAEGPKKVLVIGASTGYGLASRIAVTYGYGADTIGVAFEKEAKGKRTATAGWYNTKAFEQFAAEDGYYARSFNGDGFSKEMKEQVIEAIKSDWGQVEMVVYSMAAPRRTLADGTTVSSVLKTVGQEFTNKTIDLRTNEITEVTVPVANEEEIANTVKVMGGEDWEDWIRALAEAGVLADNAVTLAYSYIGPVVTHAIYKDGSIGQAKKHLYDTAVKLTKEFAGIGLQAHISVNKALVTQSSAAIPIVPLYISLVYKVMKEEGLHEGCIEQMYRLFTDKLLNKEMDSEGRLRLDDWELQDNVQEKIAGVWDKVTTENIQEYGDIDGYWEDFYQMFGFHYDNVDYEADVEI
ncbi:MAG: trans-2-enoyl-CoA reductase family protein [Lachnospiraceae bacterium]|nr:trans-2-enoyl-CoA reductase family protein [Lachnospiraceae bacterium]